MKSRKLTPFMQFLQHDLAISDASLQLVLQQSQQTPSLLPMIPWQYGLVTLTQLQQFLDE